MTALARHDAAVVVEQALSAVFDSAVVARLREDSPLSSLGLADADWVAVADAVHTVAQPLGSTCVLTDTDVQAVGTVADLIEAVQACSARGTANGENT